MARGVALAAALAAAFLAVSGAGGASAQQTPKRGGTVTIVRPAIAEPACLNPFSCGWGVDPTVMQVLEGAFEAGPGLVFRPNLVSAVTPRRNPPTLTYHIRPEARWSDGVPITARDFQFTHDAYAAHWTDAEGWYDNVRRTRVLDAKTFQVELHKRRADWRYLYQLVLPSHVLTGEDVRKVWSDRIENPKTGTPIASGPFLLLRLERGRQLTLVRNRRYWGPHAAYLDRWVDRFVTENPRDPLEPLREDKVDVGTTLGSGQTVTAELARDIRRSAGWRVAVWPTSAKEHFVFRVGPGGHPALKLRLVRQALAYGIDRVAIARDVQPDVPKPRPLDSTVLLTTERFYQPTWRRYRYDVARARRLLEQAGCRRGSGGVYECAGERLRLRLVTTAGSPDRQRIVALAAAHLREVGVDVIPEYAPPRVFLSQILPTGDFDVALFAWVGFGGFVWPEALCGNERNYGGYCSRLVARDAGQHLLASPGQRARNLNAVDAKLATAVPVLPVVQPVTRAFHRSTLRGIVTGASFVEWTQNSEDWWLAEPR